MKVHDKWAAQKTIFLLTLITSTMWLLGSTVASKPIELNQNFLKYNLRNPQVSNLTHTVQIRNLGPSEMENLQLYVPLIQNETARHLAVINNISPAPQKFLEDKYGNVYAYWNVETILKGKTLTVSINYYVIAFSVNFWINSSLVGTYDENSVIYREYTKSEELIESDNSLIVSAANDIVGEETNSHEIVLKIYQFVTETLTYQAQPEERGALWALRNNRGDCSEYSFLFVALCRAMKIPSRVNTGFAFRSYNGSTSEGHMWAEYYLENYGWVPTDLTWGLFDKIDNCHFASIRCKTELTSYVNYHFSYNGNAQSDHKQTIQVDEVLIDVLNRLPIARTVHDAILKIQEAELTVAVAKILGTPLLFPSDFNMASQSLNEADLYVQRAMDGWNSQPAQEYAHVAYEKAEEAIRCVREAILKSFILIVVVPIIVVIAIMIVLVGRRREMGAEMEAIQRL